MSWARASFNCVSFTLGFVLQSSQLNRGLVVFVRSHKAHVVSCLAPFAALLVLDQAVAASMGASQLMQVRTYPPVTVWTGSSLRTRDSLAVIARAFTLFHDL